MGNLRKVCVPATYGVIAKVTTEGQGSETWVTVESMRPAPRIAYRFEYLGPLRPKIGESVLFNGMAKVEYHRGHPRYSKYYHEPVDGSPKEDWEYADLDDASCIPMGPWEVVRSSREVYEDTGEVLHGYRPPKSVEERLQRARSYVRALESQLVAERDSASPTVPALTGL